MVVQGDDSTVLVDTTPDLRVQMLRHPVRRFDGVLFTHAHADHTAGLDELRRFNAMQQEHLDVWGSTSTLADITRRFDYVFEVSYPVYGVIPDLNLHTVEDEPFRVGDLDIAPVPVMHGKLPILGFRFGSIAYLTDVKSIPEASKPLLQNLDVLVLTALRKTPHPAHLSLNEAIEIVDELRPRRTLLNHVAHDMGRYEEVAPQLPPGVDLAWDEMRVTVDPDATADARVRIDGPVTTMENRS